MGTLVISDGLYAFTGVGVAGYLHHTFIADGKKPKDLPVFHWVNTILGNVKTSLSGAYHAFVFGKYAGRYLLAIAYRFNRRFDLEALPLHLLIASATCSPQTEKWLRKKAEMAS